MSKRYFIETVRSAYANGGMGCGGWHPGPATAEIKVKADDGEQFYLSVSRFDYGICFFKTEESTFDNQIEEVHDQDFWDNLDKRMTADGDRIDGVLLENIGDPLILLYKYLSMVVEHVKDGEVIQVNRYVDEIINEISDQNQSIESSDSMETTRAQANPDGALRTYIKQSLLDWQEMTQEQKEKACLEMVKLASAELQNEEEN